MSCILSCPWMFPIVKSIRLLWPFIFILLHKLFSFDVSCRSDTAQKTLQKNLKNLINDNEVCFFSDIYSNIVYCRSWLNTQFPNKVCTLKWIKSVLKLEYSRALQLNEGKLSQNGYYLFGYEKIIRIIISKLAQKWLPKLDDLIWFLTCAWLSKRYLCFFITLFFFF